MKKLLRILVAVCLCVLTARTAVSSPITHLVDFIPDGSRTGFNGFEAIPNNGTFFTGGAGPYTEGGIVVQQLNADPGNDIWVTFFSPEGNFGWYPNGGDSGSTRITRAGGVDFDSVGFLRSTGSSLGTLFFDLFNNSILVFSGSVPQPANGVPAYLGWSGGGFDEIRIRDDRGGQGNGLNALALDAIEIADGTAAEVPEPATMLLVGSGLVAFLRRRSARSKQTQ